MQASLQICKNGLSIFDSSVKQLKTDIYELHQSEDDPIVDLVLIHGIRGSVFWTWRERDDPLKAEPTRCWPKVLIFF